MRRVIVNSTPLIVLCGIGKLNVLREMYHNESYEISDGKWIKST